MEFKVQIYHVEYFTDAIIVNAESEAEALSKAEAAWKTDDSLYEQTTDMTYDTETHFLIQEKLNDIDRKYLRKF